MTPDEDKLEQLQQVVETAKRDADRLTDRDLADVQAFLAGKSATSSSSPSRRRRQVVLESPIHEEGVLAGPNPWQVEVSEGENSWQLAARQWEQRAHELLREHAEQQSLLRSELEAAAARNKRLRREITELKEARRQDERDFNDALDEDRRRTRKHVEAELEEERTKAKVTA